MGITNKSPSKFLIPRYVDQIRKLEHTSCVKYFGVKAPCYLQSNELKGCKTILIF